MKHNKHKIRSKFSKNVPNPKTRSDQLEHSD